MERTAEEFVHRLPSGRWFVGDFVGRDRRGREVFLVAPRSGTDGVEMAIDAVEDLESGVPTYARKGSAKRAAQRMIERVLDGGP